MCELTSSTLKVAAQMLSLMVEVIVIRDHLVNSGTSLTWKVALCGLPAAGICSVALLGPQTHFQADGAPSFSQLIQDLNVLVVEIRLGAWIQKGHPNFALFTQATQTIQSLLDAVMSRQLGTDTGSTQAAQFDFSTMPDSTVRFQPWEFEMDFWTSLEDQLKVYE
ncbi:hypothetical protein TruAng_006657 [Truncatella angustata]|nr:hypothetical protein TruAng_006657 [Truncatella angustata]